VLFEPGGDRIMLASSKGEAWRDGIAWGFIQKCVQEGTAVVVQVLSDKHFLIPDGQSVKDIWRRITEDARRRGFVG
jgi:hypothetical protein